MPENQANRTMNHFDLSRYDNHSHFICQGKTNNFTNLIGKSRDTRLIESLVTLEESGVESDFALFILGEITICGVCDE